MSQKGQFYKCSECGQILYVVQRGSHPVCCNLAMDLLEEQTAEMKNEKHVPVIEKIEGGYRVFVGSTEHPMTEKHYIVFIELRIDDEVHIQYLQPNQKPEAFFYTKTTGNVTAREYCNLHGLWINTI